MLLRFAGQFYDQKTDLHYNNQRNYNPDLGRYTQSDPIGLEGGWNTFTYVEGNPLRWVDPIGLERFLGEDVACEYLEKHNNNPEQAWYDIRAHRNTYKGLREADRNAEHYLYARYALSENSYNWMPMHLQNFFYGLWEKSSNAIGLERFEGSPLTGSETSSGFFGSQDGLFEGDPCNCKK